MDQGDPTSKRFSHVYLMGGEALPDSKRARVRIAHLLSVMAIDNAQLGRTVARELGVDVPFSYGGYQFRQFLDSCELRDFLDFVSLVSSSAHPTQTVGKQWISESRRIFAEEQLRYVINDAGGVRFSIDAQFESAVQTTIRSLGHATLKGAFTSYEHALDAMSKAPPDGKTAIRSLFEAVEIAFKTLCPGPARIGGSEIAKHLVPELSKEYAADKIAMQVAAKMASSLSDWVEAAHFYRHGQTGPEPVQPPLDLAVALVSEGMSFLRWLARLHVASLRKDG